MAFDEPPHRLTSEEFLATILATACHDYKHPGYGNSFLVNTFNPLALRYNDTAVLENFHASSLFELMAHDPSYNFMAQLSPESRKLIRDLIISIILSTDMVNHFEYVGRFKNKMTTGLDWNLATDRKLILIMVMKAADLNNASKPFATSKIWTSNNETWNELKYCRYDN